MDKIRNLLLELDKLKSVHRRAYLSDGSRNENSAEHSWHLAVALIALKEFIPESVDIDHAIKMALMHDICEIGAGDLSVYDPERADQTRSEEEYLAFFALRYGNFGNSAAALWQEYENQQTPESKWVKVVDRLLPFLLNIAAQGKTWKELSIRRNQVINLNQDIAKISPELFEWMKAEIDTAVQNGWLIDG